MHVTVRRFFLCLMVSWCASAHGWAADWPQFLGSTRNGVYAGQDLADAWPAERPVVVWRKNVGEEEKVRDDL